MEISSPSIRFFTFHTTVGNLLHFLLGSPVYPANSTLLFYFADEKLLKHSRNNFKNLYRNILKMCS